MNAIGDAIMTQPAWANLKISFPRANIDLICKPHIAPLFKGDPSIDSVIPFDHRKHRSWIFKGSAHIEDLLKRRAYDLIIDFTALPLTSCICARHASPPSIGFRREMTSLLGKFNIAPAYDFTCSYSETEPIREVMARLVERYTGANLQKPLPKLYVSNRDLENSFSFLKKNGLKQGKYIVIHPGGKWPPKRWPVPYWQQLIEFLEGNIRLPLVIMGNKKDEPLVTAVLSGFEKKSARAAISEDLVLSAAIIKTAALCICNDSAPMHIAAAVGTSSVALFGPVSPERSAPSTEEGCRILYDQMFCSPCILYYARNRCRRGINFCMYAIQPETVHNEILHILS